MISTMSDRIRLNIDIINIRFEYSDTDTVLNVEYPDSDMDGSKPLYTDSVSDTVGKYPYHFHPYLRGQLAMTGRIYIMKRLETTPTGLHVPAGTGKVAVSKNLGSNSFL
jgi:hypothetical protein